MELYGVIKPQKNPPKRVQLPKRSDKKESKIVKVVNETQTPLSVTDDSSVTCSKDSTDTRTTEATTEESKTQLGSKTETSVTGTVVEADKTQEKSPIDSIATAEVNILSRKVY
ncbi:hypothetical protein L3Y34_003763 [Caenorhabditis briggsae]|nr:hypothetical protein L3Y34_003763 [Caenorhabditis briggsae]